MRIVVVKERKVDSGDAIKSKADSSRRKYNQTSRIISVCVCIAEGSRRSR